MDRANFVERIGKPPADAEAAERMDSALSRAAQATGFRANFVIVQTSIQTPFNLPPRYAS